MKLLCARFGYTLLCSSEMAALPYLMICLLSMVMVLQH